VGADVVVVKWHGGQEESTKTAALMCVCPYRLVKMASGLLAQCIVVGADAVAVERHGGGGRRSI
jgi:hypothetical protein